jgi:hypothetical protein
MYESVIITMLTPKTEDRGIDSHEDLLRTEHTELRIWIAESSNVADRVQVGRMLSDLSHRIDYIHKPSFQ